MKVITDIEDSRRCCIYWFNDIIRVAAKLKIIKIPGNDYQGMSITMSCKDLEWCSEKFDVVGLFRTYSVISLLWNTMAKPWSQGLKVIDFRRAYEKREMITHSADEWDSARHQVGDLHRLHRVQPTGRRRTGCPSCIHSRNKYSRLYSLFTSRTRFIGRSYRCAVGCNISCYISSLLSNLLHIIWWSTVDIMALSAYSGFQKFCGSPIWVSTL